MATRVIKVQTKDTHIHTHTIYRHCISMYAYEKERDRQRITKKF